MSSQLDNPTRSPPSDAPPSAAGLSQKLLAGAGILAALAASSCCLLPLALFALGVSGAWIGAFTRLAPFQPYFLVVAACCLGFGYWLRRRSSKIACAAGEICARPLPSRIVAIGMVLATVLVAAALALDFIAPLFY